MPDINDLSEREREILHLVATGASNKEIAQQLYISANTVKVHLRNIFSKIHVASRTEAAMFAVKVGLVGTEAAPKVASVEPPAGNGAAVEGFNPLPLHSLVEPVNSAGWTSRRRWLYMGGLGLVVVLAAVLFWTAWSRPNPAPPALTTPEVSLPQRWQGKEPLPVARSGLAVAVYEDRLYAIAGSTPGTVTGTVSEYNPDENKWVERAPKPLPVGDVQAAVVGGKIYVPGGKLASGSPTDVLEVYDPRSDAWERRAALPQAVNAYALAAFEGRLYLFGGWDGSRFVSAVYRYDPSRDEWAELTAMPTARGYAGAAVASGKIFVVGGTDGIKALAVNEAYLPDQDDGVGNPWQPAEPLLEGRYALGMTSVADIVQVVGGINNEGKQLPALSYFPQTNEWLQYEAPPVAGEWAHFGLAAVATNLYAVGGELGKAPVGYNLSYQVIFTVAIPLVR